MVETSLLVALVPTARRAPSRDALVKTYCTMTIRPYSTIPNINRTNNGAIIANSTTAAPRRCLFGATGRVCPGSKPSSENFSEFSQFNTMVFIIFSCSQGGLIESTQISIPIVAK